MSIFNKIKTNKIIINDLAINNNDGTNKEYVDINAFNIISSVKLKTASSLSYTGTNPLTSVSNEALIIDGVNCSINDRILVSSEATTSDVHNGVYVVTDAGSATTQWILTRSLDSDENSELNKNSYVFVNEGDTNADTGWITTSSVDIGVSSIIWQQFSSSVSGSMKTSTGIIDIDDNTPSVGQTLIANSATNATWQTVSGLTAANVGTGIGVYKDTTASFNFKSLLDDNVIDITSSTNEVTIGLTQGNITSVGALTSGSILPGFGGIATSELKIQDGVNYLTIASDITTNRTLTLDINSDITLGLNNNLTFLQGGTTTLTLPISGTISTLSGVETLTNKTLLTNNDISANKLKGGGGDIVLSGTPSTDDILVANSSTTASWVSRYGSDYYYGEDLAESTTTSRSYVLKNDFVTGTLNAGNYRILWSFNGNTSTTNRSIEVEILLDNVTQLDKTIIKPKDTLADITVTSFVRVALTNSTHSIKVNFRIQDGSGTAYINNVKLEVFRI